MNQEKDCSQTYMPIWRRQIIIILVFAIGVVIAALLRNRALLFISFGAMLVTGVINLLILKCPACGTSICWNTKSHVALKPSFIPFDKKCPRCGAILRK